MRTHLTIHLSGAAHAVAAVTALLAAEPCLQLPVAWTLRTLPCGRCEIRGEGSSARASTWVRAVEAMLAPPVPLDQIRVEEPGRGMP